MSTTTNRTKRVKNKKKRTTTFRVIRAFALSVLGCMLLGVAIIAVYAIKEGKMPKWQDFLEKGSQIISDSTNREKEQQLNVLVIGEDKAAGLTDVLMYVSLDFKAKSVNIVSIPRDTYVKFDDSTYEEYKKIANRLPQVIKINAAANYYTRKSDLSKKENNIKRYNFTQTVIEYKLGIEFDYWVQMDLSGFRQIVDSIGGVTMDVPRNFDYDDADQDLYIHIPKGLQTLNGAQAEGIVRFRKGYDNGDLGRIEMQHLFMKAFIKQALSEKNILNSANIVGKLYNDNIILTTMPLTDALIYASDITKLSSDNFAFDMLPGAADYIDKKSYYILDEAKTKTLLESVDKKREANSSKEK